MSNSNEKMKIIIRLLNIAEEMLFSISLKPEIVKKYQDMRESVFKKLCLQNDFNKYLELQTKAQETAETKKNSYENEKKMLKKNLEEAKNNLATFLSLFNQIIISLKSDSKEPGSLETEKVKIPSVSLNINNYESELNKFESDIVLIIKKNIFLEKHSKNFKEIVDSLASENKNLVSEITNLKIKHKDSLKKLENESIIQQVSNSNLCESKNFNDLELSFYDKDTKFVGQMDKLINEDFSVSNHLREKLEKSRLKNENLRTVLKAVSDRTSIIFDEFVDKYEIFDHFIQRKQEIEDSNDSKTWHYFSEMLAEIDFIGYSFHKVKGDNE